MLALVALACGQVGCGMLHPRSQPVLSPTLDLLGDSSLPAAEYELVRAKSLEAAGDELCVESYFAACSLAWQSLDEGPPGSRSPSRQCYNEAVADLLAAAQRFGRLDPARGLVIRDGERPIALPIVHHGFCWATTDFQKLHPPPTGREPLLNRRYGCQGIGLPLVVERARNDCHPLEKRFYPEKSFFAATAVLRFDAAADPTLEPNLTQASAVLEFYNPFIVRSIPAQADPRPLACDLSAPLAATLEAAPRPYLAGFIDPGGATDSARLTFLEPYQPGKVPVVLIHGLFSDPLGWADLINDLRATTGFTERFQLWVFRYPTGQGFLQSAAILRKELQAAIAALDPVLRDEALHKMVLIGHSMGGLVAKLQVTYSEELIWSRLANRPIDEIITTEQTRAFLAAACYFDPSPDVKKVIFIASPHQGSLQSSGIIGRSAALLVEPSAEQATMHEQLLRDNPGTFNPLIERRFPTSIDMLSTRSPLLEAMRQMRLSSCVKLHNIIGVSHPISFDGPSDGIVSVHSASHPACQSVLPVNSPHAQVHRSLKTSAEILRILNCDWKPSAMPVDDLHPNAAPHLPSQSDNRTMMTR